eukprot:5271544-Lingulodinium_polyedra.AAC.1
MPRATPTQTFLLRVDNGPHKAADAEPREKGRGTCRGQCVDNLAWQHALPRGPGCRPSSWLAV